VIADFYFTHRGCPDTGQRGCGHRTRSSLKSMQGAKSASVQLEERQHHGCQHHSMSTTFGWLWRTFHLDQIRYMDIATFNAGAWSRNRHDRV
jgi:hypothetical protein